MDMILRAKIKIMLRHLPTPCQSLLKELMAENDRLEAKYRNRIAELEREMWFWKDKYQDEFLQGKNL